MPSDLWFGAVVALVVVVGLLLYVIRSGCRASIQLTTSSKSFYAKEHVVNVLMLDSFILLLVGLIESLVRVHDGLWVTGREYKLHMALVGLFVFFWVLAHIFNGYRFKYHYVIVYLFGSSAIVLSVSGALILFQYPA